ncbi:MAG: M3 family oligoendopeptidase [Chloroflexi bacterium]|nr:M3 family oligoendopeptidase [Chloroflexota bacterium]OJV89552.1 MAG: M3 family oligoendopeptidase [Chloroflexi bacterium 54-19]
MLATLPKSVEEVKEWNWETFEPYYRELEEIELTPANIDEWLKAWTDLLGLAGGKFALLNLANTQNTADLSIQSELNSLRQTLDPPIKQAEQRLTEKLLASGLQAPGMSVALRQMRVQADIFREANIALGIEEQKLLMEFNRITGAQTVEFDGREQTLQQLRAVLQSDDRTRREASWKAGSDRQLADREALNNLYGKLLHLRQQMAENAGEPDYRALRWKMLNRFDYTPQDCETFHAAIEEVVVPAAARVLERRRQRLGIASVRPWDLDVDPSGLPPLRPFQDTEELAGKAERVFSRVDPLFGEYFATMRRENLLDLPNRKNKGPGAYCTQVPVGEKRRPFVFMNGVGIGPDVVTIHHESGHAFHNFETLKLPYAHQRYTGSEFAEVASMSMELLATPYLPESEGGYYTQDEANRAKTELLEKIILFWPYMAVVDAFQHWAYTHVDQAVDPANCDRKWGELWSRFMGAEDWSGLEDARVTGWHRKLHIFRYPFYYVEYGLAQLGAVQVFANALKDQANAVQLYHGALKLGKTVTLPELFQAAGTRFGFDSALLREAVTLLEGQLEKLA